MPNNNPLKLITHNGSFHSDDIFAAATLVIYLEKKGESLEIIRTRDEAIIATGDYVFDVGGVSDPEKNRFDHHQKGGAGRRPGGARNEIGIEYASFGLVWKKFGEELTESAKVVDLIDKKLTAPIDAWDNGFDLVQNKYDISPYFIQHAFVSMVPTWREETTVDEMFLKCVEIAKIILSREIVQAEDALLAEESIVSAYQNAADKRIIILDRNYPFEFILHKFPEPLFVVYFKESSNSWRAKAVREDPKTFINRKNFPEDWAGLRDEELQKVSGVPDATFCHKGLFLAVAKSKEGAMELAKKALAR